MLIKDILKISLLNALRGKIRTVLTALSIMIGVASVLLVASIGSGGEKVIIGEIEKLGLSGIAISQNINKETSPLRSEDAELLKRNFSEISDAMPIVMEYGTIKFNKVISDSVILGVGARADKIYNVNLLYGRVPNEVDIRSKRNVVVIDDELAEKSYKRINVVGKEIVVNLDGKKDKYEVIGVIKSQKDGINQMLGGGIPDFIYMPYTTVNEVRNDDTVSQVAVKCIGDDMESGEKFADYLSLKKGLDNAYISENMTSKIGEIKSITNLVSLIISAIAAISLCVAGIGVMNTMFSSTAERYREIGICMAVGASSRDISLCFFAESIIISLLGGTAGAVVGWAGTFVISKLIGVESIYSVWTFIGAEVISILCGAIFSVIPAVKASRLDPIITLRND